ncbi:hypothetical protein Q3O60_00025 [Alkalimonas collagenimarina]|uniref:Lipoprotein n=1 Tax=Alkalimonas collagenimarina TaxID=400390 RepID=A0ABT9GU81_9GAMM|nr:hypothetical protein [Alkalimonas collagenimarina]MDP4534581.1 hypothetical protein [Alkalimonas collagenimarina]
MLKATIIALVAFSLLACAQAPTNHVGALTNSELEQLKDRDEDGVIRQRDLCPQTGSAALVTVDGCSSLQTQHFVSVHPLQFYRDDRILGCAELRSLMALIKHFQLAEEPIELTLLAHQIQGQAALDRGLFDRRIAYLKERLWAEYRHKLPAIKVRVDTVQVDDAFVMNPNQIAIKAKNLSSGEVLKWHIYSMEGRAGDEVDAHSASGW